MPKGVYIRTEEYKKKMRGEGNNFYGKHHTKETRKKMSEAHKGIKNHFYGKHLSKEIRRRMSEAKKGKCEKNSIAWKGNKAGKVAFHLWIYCHWGKANHCELCGKKGSENGKAFVWANIKNHKYTRDIKDYIQLCSSCHKRMDTGIIDIEIVRELRKKIVYNKI